MKEAVKVDVKLLAVARDGGTCVYWDAEQNQYYKDGRINSPTKGKVFDKYPDNDGAKILDVELIIQK